MRALWPCAHVLLACSTLPRRSWSRIKSKLDAALQSLQARGNQTDHDAVMIRISSSRTPRGSGRGRCAQNYSIGFQQLRAFHSDLGALSGSQFHRRARPAKASHAERRLRGTERNDGGMTDGMTD